ncbi:membrane protein [soil metagenome]
MMTKALLFSFIPMVAAIVAAIIAALQKPSSVMKSLTQHLAAGVVFAAVALEMGPDLLKRHESLSTAVGFSIGVALLVGIGVLTEKKGPDSKAEEREGKTATSVTYLVTVATDLFVDGLMIGIGFIAGAKAGLLLTVALTLELISLALALVGQLREDGKSKSGAVFTTSMLTCLVPLGAVIGLVVLARMPVGVINGTIAAGTAALLYLVTEELLREAHEQPEGALTTATFFAGFLLVMLIDMQLG